MKPIRLSGYLSVQLTCFLQSFLTEVSPGRGMPDHAKGLVKDVVFAMAIAGSTMLSRLARHLLHGPKRLIHREKRLSRQMKSKSWTGHQLSVGLRDQGTQLLKRNGLICIDTSDLVKPYGQKMQGLDWIHDSSRHTTGPGYWLVGIFVRIKCGQLFPLLVRAFSLREVGIRSFNAVLIQAISFVAGSLENWGIWVADRGFDALRLLEPMLKMNLRFIVRLVGSRDLVFIAADGSEHQQRVRCWVQQQLTSGQRILRAKVRLPKRAEILDLIVAPPELGRHSQALLLLSRGVFDRQHDERWIISAYRQRWVVEDGLRAFKQNFGIEHLRVRSLRAIQRLVVLAAVSMAFVIWLQQRAKAQVKRVLHVAALHFGQPLVYEFCRFAAGLRNLLGSEQLQHYISQLAPG